MSALTDLQASEASLATVVTAAVAAITSLAAQLATAVQGNDDAGVEAVVGQLNTLSTQLQAALPAAPAAAK